MIVEIAVGYPDQLFRAIGHPVTWIGRLIAAMDRNWNRPSASFAARRAAGAAAVAVLMFVCGGLAFAIQYSLGGGLAIVIVAVVASSLIAQRSLHSHVAAVAQSLETEGLAGGRKAVSQIVGRDPESLDEAGVSRAAIESLAENFSDGIVAPVFWLAVGGLPGGAVYKAVNTADSMIGHRTERHEAFGWAAARLDDLINLPASRLSAVLICVASTVVSGASPKGALQAVWRDASRHRSPNAGWPEAAMAVVLDIALSGPRSYHGERRDYPWVWPEGRRTIGPDEIDAAVGVLWRAWAGALALTLLLALLF